MAEGKAELGDSTPHVKLIPQEGGKPIPVEKEGALHTLIRRELAQIGFEEVDFIQKHPAFKVKKKNYGRLTESHSILNQKHIHQAVADWMCEINLLVIVVDLDEGGNDARKKDLAKAVEIASLNIVDENEIELPNRVVDGLAIKTFDTWLIADAINLNETLKISVDVPDDLESLPAGDSPQSSKNLLNRFIQQSDLFPTENENRKELKCRWLLAKTIDLGTIRQACPKGYETFSQKLLNVASGIS